MQPEEINILLSYYSSTDSVACPVNNKKYWVLSTEYWAVHVIYSEQITQLIISEIKLWPLELPLARASSWSSVLFDKHWVNYVNWNTVQGTLQSVRSTGTVDLLVRW